MKVIIGSHIMSSRYFNKPTLSSSFRIPRLLLGHPDYFFFVVDLEYLHTQAVSLCNVPHQNIKRGIGDDTLYICLQAVIGALRTRSEAPQQRWLMSS